jgi:hypothetical protein
MIKEQKEFKGKMMSQMVNCINTFRLTDLNGECADTAGWTDCVEEDESYLEDIGFYSEFSDRRRPKDPTNPLEKDNTLSSFYPGYQEAKECVDTSKRIKRDKTSYQPSYYYAPKVEPLWVKQVSQCRVIMSRGGDHHKRCDRIAETRPLTYQQAVELFPPGTDLSHDASDFDLLEF